MISILGNTAVESGMECVDGGGEGGRRREEGGGRREEERRVQVVLRI